MDNLNREFHELRGYGKNEAYFWCNKCQSEKSPMQVTCYGDCIICEEPVEWKGPPDYAADARLVLREMREREDYELFVIGLNDGDLTRWLSCPIRLILDNTGLLLRKAVDWLRREGKKP